MLLLPLLACLDLSPAELTQNELSVSRVATQLQGADQMAFGQSLSTWAPLAGEAPWLVIGALTPTSASDTPGDLWLLSEPAQGLVQASAQARIQGPSGSRAGSALYGGADLDGDGAAELLVSAPWDSSGSPLGGSVFVLSGPIYSDIRLEVAASDRLQGAAYERLGAAVLGADLDGDGADEVIVGVSEADTLADNAGQVRLWSDPSQATPSALWSHPTAGTHAAQGLWRVGDIDGDGRVEIAVGAPRAQRGRGAVTLMDAHDGERLRARLSIEGPTAGHLGQAVAVGDLNADGQDDLVLGAPGWDQERGRVYVFFGPVDPNAKVSSADWRLSGQQAGDGFGSSLAVLNSPDGSARLLVGAPGRRQRGALYSFDPTSAPSQAYLAQVQLLGGAEQAMATELLIWPTAGGDTVVLSAPGERAGTAGAVYFVPAQELQ